jgi:hypothetical protein
MKRKENSGAPNVKAESFRCRLKIENGSKQPHDKIQTVSKSIGEGKPNTMSAY